MLIEKLAGPNPNVFLFKFPRGQSVIATGSDRQPIHTFPSLLWPFGAHSPFSQDSEWLLLLAKSTHLSFLELIQDLGNKPLETLDVQLHRELMLRIDFAKIKTPILSLVWFHATTCVAVSKFRMELDWGSYVSFCLALAAILSCSLLHSWSGLFLKGAYSAYVVRLLIISCLLKTLGLWSQRAKEYTKFGEGVSQSLDLCTL